MKKIITIILISCAMLFSSSVLAEEEEAWEKYSPAEHTKIVEEWLKAMPYQDAIPLIAKLHATEIWLKIQEMKVVKCETQKVVPVITTPTQPPPPSDWTNLGGISVRE